MGWAKTTARRDENHLSFVIWCAYIKTFYGTTLFAIMLYAAAWRLGTVI